MAAFRKLLPMGVVIVGLIGVGGCGLSDYQNRMDAQRARIQKLDDLKALLDDPIDMPAMKFHDSTEDRPAWPFEVFLRLPNGFATKEKDRTPWPDFAFFRYDGGDPSHSIYVVAAQVAEKDTEEGRGKYTPKKFPSYVKTALEQYYLKTHKFNLKLLDAKGDPKAEAVDKVAVYPEEKPILYKTYEYRDSSNTKLKDLSVFRFHFYEADGKQICIVEQRPLRTPNENFDKAMKVCLGTLDIGNDAARKRTEFKKGKG